LQTASREALRTLHSVAETRAYVVCRSCDAIADVDCAVGYIPHLTAADDAGYEIGETEVSTGRCPEICRGIFCRVRRLIADMQHSTPAEPTALDPEQATLRTASHPQETARQEMDRGV
jgi:hypothetical protein